MKKINGLSLVVYNSFIFPLTIGFFVIYLLMANTRVFHNMYQLSTNGSYIVCIFMILISYILFYEWKTLLLSLGIQNPYLSMNHCHKRYIAVYLSCILATSIILCYSFQNDHFNSTSYLLGLNAFLFLWIIIQRPYSHEIHNIGVVINLFPIVFFLSWSVAKRYFSMLLDQKIEEYLVVSLIITLLLSVLACILRIIYILWMKVQISKQKSN